MTAKPTNTSKSAIPLTAEMLDALVPSIDDSIEEAELALIPKLLADSDSEGKARRAVIPPKKITAEMSVFEYLKKCQPPLDKKIIDIACSQSGVPSELKDDAAQEISIMWSQMKPDTSKYKPGQIAAYAHRMAGHAALRLRRELGSSVRLPGSAFRKRKDGSSYVTPGVLAAALDWSELETWFQTEDKSTDKSSIGLSQDMAGAFADEESQIVAEENSEELLKAERLDMLEAHKEELSPRQYTIMKALIEGATYEDIMKENEIKKGVLMREVSIASSLMLPLDF